MAKNNKSTEELDAFAREVERTLEHFADSAWLGTHSPLSAPYMLGGHLGRFPTGENEEQRGRALQSVLVKCAKQLDGETRDLLRVAFFKLNPNLDNVGLALSLNLSERTFYRSKMRAINQLAQQVNKALMPSLRPESVATQAMVGRGEALRNAISALRAGHSVMLLGASGIGKTTLGTEIVRIWQTDALKNIALPGEQKFFWYTLRAGLNDHLQSFIFALAYFLRSNGAANTWRQLVVDQGIRKAEQILALLRYDFAQLPVNTLLLCIDELDTLQSDAEEHAQFVYLLEELRRHLPLLLIGQRMVCETDEQYTLTGFSADELLQFLAARGLQQLSITTQQQLHVLARGNPALLTLLCALAATENSFEAAIQSFGNAPSLEALFNRIWRRLGDDEKLLLMRLAVFRTPSPLDAWHEYSSTLQLLFQRELVQFDGLGAVRPLPHIQQLLYERIPIELKRDLHFQAVAIREARAEYLDAIYHAIEARQNAHAIWLWFRQRTSEIEYGRGVAALALLKRIAQDDLPDERDRTALRIARAELFKLAAEPEAAEAELQAAIVPRRGRLRAYVQQLHGDVLEMSGRMEQAIEHYREALESLTGTPELREVTLRTRIGFFNLTRFNNPAQAKEEALRARLKAEGFHGNVEELAGNYRFAEARYQAACQLAESLENDLESRSRAYSQLGALALRRGEWESAITWILKAIDCDERRGDSVSPLYDQLNLAYVYTQCGRYHEACEVALSAHKNALQLNHTYFIAGLSAGVGEAYYGLQQYDEAEGFAMQSLNQEEEFFRAPALTLLALVYSAKGKHGDAMKTAEAAIESARDSADKFSEAYAWKALAAIRRDANQPQATQAAWQAALQLYSELGLAKEVEIVENEMKAVVEFIPI